jgi:type II secretion system protein D
MSWAARSSLPEPASAQATDQPQQPEPSTQPPPTPTPTQPPASAPDSQPSPQQATPPAPAQPDAAVEKPDGRIRFNFKGATFSQVLDFFSRVTGLPVVKEADVPEGTLDYLSPESYDLPEALRVLNIVLQSRGVMLRASGDMLYLQKLDKMKQEDVPTFIGQVPAEITGDQIITVVRPLNIALAKPLAEKLAAMVADYGGVTPMEQQNSIVITETAAQVRRLLGIIEELDRQDTEGAVEIFKVQHASAKAMMEPLKALLSERVEKFVINQQGQQVKIEEDQLPGLSISADERTNSIIAKGVANRLDKLREAITLLDVPAAGQSRSIQSFTLTRLVPSQSLAQFNALFEKSPPEQRPIFIAQDDSARLTFIGDETQLIEARTLLDELDGGSGEQSQPQESSVKVIALQHAAPQPLIDTIASLLSARQKALTRLVAGPDGKSLVLSGSAVDVETIKALAAALDQPPQVDRQVRLVRLSPQASDPAAIVARARELWQQSHADEAGAALGLTATIEPETRTATIIGSAAALDEFSQLLKSIESSVIIERETRAIRMNNREPSEVAAILQSLPQPLMQQIGSASLQPPQVTAVDDLDLLLVTTEPQLHQVFTQFVTAIDVPQTGELPPLRILRLRTADAPGVAQTLLNQYNQRPAEQKRERPVNIIAEAQTNSLLVAAHPDAFAEIQQIVSELNKTEQITAEDREIRIFPLKVARAPELAKTIDEMFPEPPVPTDARGRPLPHLRPPREVVVRADIQTNSLIVDAPMARIAGFETLVEQLDRQQALEQPQIRTYRVELADVTALANTLRELAQGGSLGAPQSGRVPVTIASDAITRTIIVTGPDDVFARVEQVLAELDAVPAGPATTVRFFKLTAAKAEAVAPMLREILTSRLRQEIPQAVQQVDGSESRATFQSLLNVTADQRANALIISAPQSIMPVAEELIRQLDSGASALGQPIVRVRPLTFASAADVAQALSAAAGTMVSQATGEPMSLRVVASPGSNAIMLVGLEVDVNEIEPLIEPLDARPPTDAIDARTFALQFAHAAAVAPIVQRLLAAQQETDPRILLEQIRRSRGQVDITPKIRVEADARTNSLIISGPQQTVSLAETLIAQLDKPDDAAQKSHDTYTAANSSAAALVQAVQRIVAATQPAGRRSTLELIAEPQSNSIVLVGAADEIGRAKALLQQFDDRAMQPPQIDFRIVTLKHSDAATVAQAAQPMLADRSRWPESLRAAAQAGLAIAQPSVTPDASMNRLLISAPSELMPVSEQIIAQLDRAPDAGQSVDVRIVNLKQAKAADVAAAVSSALAARAQQQPGEPRASITPEPSSNSLVIAATPAQLAAIESIIAPLDQNVAVDQPQVRTVFLKHARAENIAPIVQQLLEPEDQVDVNALPNWARVEYLRSRQNQPAPAEVRIAADPRLNAVVISALPGALNVAEQMVAQLDVDPAQSGAPSSARSVRVLLVENADVSELAASVEAMFSDAANAGGEAPPVIRIDSASSSLIVRATDAQFAQIEQLVSSIDAAAIATSRQIRMIPIDPARASAEDVARTLQKLLDRSAPGSGGVEVITVEELIKRRQQRDARNEASSEPAKQQSSAPARDNAIAPRLAWIFACIVAFQSEQDTQQSEPDVTIAFDPATNSLMVVGSPRAIERIAGLADQIQQQIPPLPAKARFIALPAALDAASLANLVQQALQRMPAAIPGAPAGTLAQRSAVLADEAGNSLIVIANDSDFETIGDLIAALSQPIPGAGAGGHEEIVVRVYPLTNITAERAAQSVRGLLGGDEPRRTGAGRGRQAQRMRDLAMKLLMQDQTIEAVFDPNRVSVNADAASNSLVVIGPAEAIGFVNQFIELIDQSPVNQQATLKIYSLKHAKSDELQDTLRSLFQARFRSMRDELGAGAIQPEFASDERTNTLLVTASPEQLAEIDGLLKDLDAATGEERHPLRIIELAAAQPQKAAEIIKQVVIGTDQARRSSTLIAADNESGVLLVRAADDVNAEIDQLLPLIDRHAADEYPVRTLTLERADAASVAGALQRFFDDRAKIASTGRGRREQARRVSIIGESNSRTLLIAATDEDFEQIQQLVKQFDTPDATAALSFRVFQLKHAKATEIEDTVTSLVSDLTWNQGPSIIWWGGMFGGGGNRANQQDRGVLAVRADARLNALIVTGEGDKFDVVERIIEVLDAPVDEGQQRLVRIYRVAHADLNTVAEVVRENFGLDPGAMRRRWWEPPDPTELRVRSDPRTNTLIVSGSARQHDDVASLVAALDEQTPAVAQATEVLPVQFGRASEIAQTLRQFLADRARATNAPEPSATIVASESANTLVVSADDDQLATIRDLLSRLDQADAPGGTGERVIEIIALQEGKADEIARIVREQFGRGTGGPAGAATSGGGGGGGRGVIVTPDVRTNSIIINAPAQQFEQAKALIAQLDAPSASDETIIRTYALKGARADDAVRILTQTLQLDSRGQTPGKGITIKLDEAAPDSVAVEVKARIVADRRSNSIVVTATEPSFPVIERLIAKLEEVPAASPVEYRLIPLQHATAADVAYTLRQFTRGLSGRDGAAGGAGDQPQPQVDYNSAENQLIIAATADQFEQINRIISEIDQPSESRRVTDFVPLAFAEAEKVQEALSFFYGPFAPGADTPGHLNVRIVADTATNSLVISAAEDEWTSIRALLAKLDSEEYDASLQLRVIPLEYADATSVAGAINDAFRGQMERQQRAPAGAQGAPPRNAEREGQQPAAPTLLVESDEWVGASAETQTNSVIVSASRQNMRKIEQIIEQLDVADYATLPPPRIIPVMAGNPAQLAESLNKLYAPDGRQGEGRQSMRIVGDAALSAIIVRAEEEDFAQISALAEAMQQQSQQQGLGVHILKLTSAPAARVAAAIRDGFEATAKQTNQALSIQIDSANNSLIIASTAPLFEQIKATVAQLDAMSPGVGPGMGIFIIELQNIPPDAAKSVIETIGLDKPQPPESISRIVSEPIKVSLLSGRNAIVIVANPVDRDTIVGLVKAIDADPAMAESQVRVVKLKNAKAESLAKILGEILTPGQQQSQTALAKAVQEQVRRLAVRRNGADQPDLALDLTKPVRIIPDAAMNAIVISSTASNVAALEQIALMFDQLPITDAVTVQIFPLQNIAADDFARIVGDLFTQGKKLGGVPGSEVQGMPGGTVGRALLDDIALSVDPRTNTVVVAGKEEAVALVEVMSRRLDSEVSSGWVEPRIVQLKHADATDLSQTLQSVLVEGATNLPQATSMQRQVGRLRMARMDSNGGQVLEADVFSPMTRLVIRPEPQLNAIVLVGTPANLEVVTELVTMLDVPAASPSAVVRVYPVEHASAARLATTITQLFDQQVESKAIRPEDRVIVQAEERTNSLVVTTSPRSFAVLERLLETLDAEIAPDLREIRMVELKNASAARLAPMIQQLMDARLERLRKVQPETADLERASIVADARSNSLVVAAGNESFEVIKRLAADLDTSNLSDSSLVQVIAVTKGNIERLADAVTTIMQRRYADMPAELRAGQSPLVLTDTRTSSLLVAAGPDDLQAITDLVAKLEATPMNPAVGLHVIAVEGARAEMLAPRLQKLMQDRMQSLGESATASDRVSVEPDLPSNSLVIAASDENLEVVRGLIETLTKAGADAIGSGEFEVIQLVSSRARDMIAVLGDLYVDEENRRRGSNTIRISADDRINAVLVSAPPPDIQEIKRLAAQLDGAKPGQVVEIKYIALTSANALETVSLIENVLSGRGIGPNRSRQATVLKYLREIAAQSEGADAGKPGAPSGDELSEMEVSAAIRETITLTPDLRTNTIIVAAPKQSMQMIESMIRDLDDSTTGSQSIRIFKLTNADAEAMAEILTQLFNLQQQGNLYVLKPREPGANEAIAPADGLPTSPGAESAAPQLGGLSGTELTAVPDERQQLSITVDSRTNSLLVSGTPTYLDLVSTVVEELDSQEANERNIFVYQLRNATSADVAQVVSDFITQEQQKLVTTMGAEQIGSAARLLEREVTIVDDTKSNSVIVSVSPRYEQRVREIIQQLDIDPPQVLIQVLLAEITLDTSRDWGVDFSATADIGEFDVTGSFGLATRFVTGIGVPTLAIASDDFELLIRALHSQGRLQVLSNPSIMAANNEPARIQVGETIRVPESISFDLGSQQSSVIPEDTGVILEVTPSINPDGFVRMEINPEISELSSETIQISEDFETPIITRRNADTTVTVKDGQTIVIGGLISDRYEKRDNKVPFFGDLPLLGPLFRSENETSSKTELLIVLTPHVIHSPTEVEYFTNEEIDRLSLPEAVKEQIRKSRLEGTGGIYDARGRRIDPPPPPPPPPQDDREADDASVPPGVRREDISDNGNGE